MSPSNDLALQLWMNILNKNVINVHLSQEISHKTITLLSIQRVLKILRMQVPHHMLLKLLQIIKVESLIFLQSLVLKRDILKNNVLLYFSRKIILKINKKKRTTKCIREPELTFVAVDLNLSLQFFHGQGVFFPDDTNMWLCITWYARWLLKANTKLQSPHCKAQRLTELRNIY